MVSEIWGNFCSMLRLWLWDLEQILEYFERSGIYASNISGSNAWYLWTNAVDIYAIPNFLFGSFKSVLVPNINHLESIFKMVIVQRKAFVAWNRNKFKGTLKRNFVLHSLQYFCVKLFNLFNETLFFSGVKRFCFRCHIHHCGGMNVMM